MANQPQPFRQHHLTRALRAAKAAGMDNPSVKVRLPSGVEFHIGGSVPDPGPKTSREIGRGDRSVTAVADAVGKKPSAEHRALLAKGGSGPDQHMFGKGDTRPRHSWRGVQFVLGRGLARARPSLRTARASRSRPDHRLGRMERGRGRIAWRAAWRSSSVKSIAGTPRCPDGPTSTACIIPGRTGIVRLLGPSRAALSKDEKLYSAARAAHRRGR